MCLGIPAGMVVASTSYPAVAGVYTFRYNLLADANYSAGFFVASYTVDGKQAELKLGNDGDGGYIVDISKTLNGNLNWQTSAVRSIDKCQASAANCGVELTH